MKRKGRTASRLRRHIEPNESISPEKMELLFCYSHSDTTITMLLSTDVQSTFLIIIIRAAFPVICVIVRLAYTLPMLIVIKYCDSDIFYLLSLVQFISHII